MNSEKAMLIDCISRMLGRSSIRNLRIIYEFVFAMTVKGGNEDHE